MIDDGNLFSGVSLNGLDLLALIFLDPVEAEDFAFRVIGISSEENQDGVSPARQIASAAFTGVLRLAFANYIQERLRELDVNTGDLVRKYTEDIDAGHHVVVLAHSQGNLFANASVEAVRNANDENKNYIGLFGVANVAGRTVGDGSANSQYITADDDVIVDGLRLIINVLPSNLDNDPGVFGDFRTWSKQQFLEDYFDEKLVSRPLIDEALEDFVFDLKYPLEEAGDFAIELDFESEFPEFISFFAVTDPQGVEDIILNLRYELVCDAAKLGTYTVALGSLNAAGEETEGVSSGTISGRLGDGEALGPVVGEAGEVCPLVDIEISENDDLELDVYDYTVTLLPQDETGCDPLPPLSQQ